LKHNRDLNHCRFQIVNQALAYEAPTVDFGIERDFLSSRIDGGSATVASIPATSLKAIADSAGFDQISVICDTEGAEAALVEREQDTLRQRVRFLLVEIHPEFIGCEAASAVVSRLQAAGFTLRERYFNNWAFTRD
jgi:hypothetical protein